MSRLHPLKILVSYLSPPPHSRGGVAPKIGSEKVSHYTGVSQLQLRVSHYTVQLSFPEVQCHQQIRDIFSREPFDQAPLRANSALTFYAPEGFRGSQKGGFQRGGFGRCFPYRSFLQEDSSCSAALTEESYDLDSLEPQKPERGHICQNLLLLLFPLEGSKFLMPMS